MDLLPILNRSCLSTVVPIVPGVVTQIINTSQYLLSTHQSLSQSNILAIVLPLMLLRSGMNSLMTCVVHQLPPSDRSSKLTCLQKPIRHSLPRHPCVFLVWPGYVLRLTLTAFLYVQMRLRVHQWWRLSAIKVHIRLDYYWITALWLVFQV